jgi:asparagine synthase (glutamine-hydrolysing)
VWFDEEAGIALGHRRLAILDLSSRGHQPMASRCGRFVICFNGEIYNHRELRRELGETLPWRGRSDTEVLLEAIVRWGVEQALARSNGMFAIALWSRDERALYLARDRFGEKPLYYGHSRGHFLFGSELKALRKHPSWNGTIDREALTLLLRFGYVPAPYSIYRGIRKLLPGTWLRLRGVDAEPTIHAYWSALAVAEQGVAAPFPGTEPEAVDALEALMTDAIDIRTEADVPVGAFLSGGIDSSAVVALMQAQSDVPVRTFTIGFREADFDEAEHARAIAKHLGTSHTELYLEPREGLRLLPTLPRIWDEPFADPSQIPTLLIATLARQHVSVVLSGDGGDELFGGYARYLRAEEIKRSMGRIPRPVRRVAAGAIRALPREAWNRFLNPLSVFLPDALRVQNPGDRLHKASLVLGTDEPSAIYRSLVSHWKRPHDVTVSGSEPATRFDDEYKDGLGGDLHSMMYLDTVTYLPDDILVKVDRASMSVGLEARVPLLDHRVYELAWRMPSAWKVRGGVGKAPLRILLRRHLPQTLTDRPKKGFSVPIGGWLRGPLRDWAEALLDRDRLRREGYLNAGVVAEAWQQHLAGTPHLEFCLWDLLMFQAWLETLADADSQL